MKMSKGMFSVALALGLAGMMLGGCSNKKKQADLAAQEALELREQNATLTQGNREKDSRIAELETKLAECSTVAVVPQQQPQPNWQPPATGYQPPAPQARNDDFTINDQGEAQATIAGNALFDSGKTTIKDSAKRQLDRIAKELNSSYRGAAIRIEGHTDSDPIRKSKWASNDALSQARADAVKQYLASKGVSASRMNSIGYGSSKPKSTKAASRRVEIVVTK
ncbi:MAG TPA: OmpA family protein [Phycisphaerales bacterium]|nr:OmpA family protein [Phycisphaerales bacterium]